MTHGRPLAVIFDVDGTLVDSERDGHRVAFNKAFESAGLVDRWDVSTYGGLLEITGGERRLRHYLLQPRSSLPNPTSATEAGALAAALHRSKTSYFTDMVRAAAIPARPGVVRLLDELHGEGVPVGIATTATAAWVRPLLDRLFGEDRFAIVVTGEDVISGKPQPDAYLLALRELGMPAADVVAVEDSGPGLRAARGAGLACVVVANPYTSLHEVSDADVLLNGFGEPGAPAAVLSDPHGAVSDGMVDVASLSRLQAASVTDLR
ncbi:MAG: HAD-IA family hydrolase [Actinomycetota bacterium]|nr:HAD-IA family hydrolase [Actinomycetota bacterium]